MFYFAIAFLALIACFCRLDRIFYKQNDSFCQNRILVNWSSLPSYPSSLSPSTYEILNQPFSYLDKGKEFFVFLSFDQKWVLKFPRVPHHKNMAKTLQILRNCSTQLHEETAIEYAHLERTKTHQTLLLLDRFGVRYQIELDSAIFFLQRAGTLFFDYFHTASDPLPLIRNAIAVYRSIHSKGFTDRDAIFQKNFGVYEDKPFIMDVGKIIPATSEDSLEKLTVSLRDEIAIHYPHLLSEYKKALR